ncbi:MAG: N-acetylmuramoyl-L-alanine amidase [Verrucomicrobiota bacterium]
MHCLRRHHLLFSFVLFLGILLSSARAFDVVVLDAGHGGLDAGATWFEIQEKHLTLDLANRLDVLLKERGVKTVLTRKTDEAVSLSNRAMIANRYPGAIFVSVHFNAHFVSTTTGIETYYLSDEGKKLGRMVQERLSRRFNTKDRGAKRSNLKVLRDTKCPAILIEGGFLSNRWENQRCQADWYRQILAEEIVEGLMRYR